MQIDWTITVGNLIAAIGPVVGFILVGLHFISRIGTQVALIDLRLVSAEVNLKNMSLDLRQIAQDNTQIARITERETANDRRVDELVVRIGSLESWRLSRVPTT